MADKRDKVECKALRSSEIQYSVGTEIIVTLSVWDFFLANAIFG